MDHRRRRKRRPSLEGRVMRAFEEAARPLLPAELLKIKRTTLIEKMKRLGIPLKAGAEAGDIGRETALPSPDGGAAGTGTSHN